MRGRKRRSFDFGNFEITKREILVSVSIVAIMPVSYTHLDVYKRQEDEFAEKYAEEEGPEEVPFH